MQAIVATKYGPPEVLKLQAVAKPAPADDQVLVRVFAVSLNPAESHMRRGLLMARLLTRQFFRPKEPIPGADFAGQVEAVGREVTQYRPGDAVYGRRGAAGLAEYVAVSEKPIAHKPLNLTFEQAAAVPVAAITALQSLRDTAQVQPGQTVLINGASGGVGTFTVQLAKLFGAEVTGVCSTRNLDLVRSLGADQVIDYTREDFTRAGRQYDVIMDNVGNRTVGELLRILRPNGRCVIVGYTSIRLLIQNQVMGWLASRTGSRRIGFMLARMTHEDLVVLKDLFEAGKLRPVIDRCYPLAEAAAAYRYAETRHARGKVVLTL